jgi:hypothetical protein
VGKICATSSSQALQSERIAIGQAAGEDRECFRQFPTCEVRSEAVVRAAAESQNCGCVPARDVEALSVSVNRWISVGGKGVHENEGSCGERVPGEFDIIGGGPRDDTCCR